ncbi:hypothetical protein KKG66_02955, partial [bacterium]|nr:hypothetical protein [bacterium]
MRTLRTVFTCLCLLASFSYACEIPLLLEETIQLPEATPYWDVMPHFLGYYDWVSAVADADSNTMITWGQTNPWSLDTLLLENRGRPTGLTAFYTEGYEPSIVISSLKNQSSYITEYQTEIIDSGWVFILRLPDGSEIIPTEGWETTSDSQENIYGRGGSAYSCLRYLRYCVPLASPPRESNRIAAIIARSIYSMSAWWDGSANGGWSRHTRGDIYDNLLEPDDPSIIDSISFEYVSSTFWASSCNLVSWSNSVGAQFAGISTELFSTFVQPTIWNMCSTPIDSQTLPDSAFGIFVYLSEAPSLRSCCSIYDGLHSRVTLVESWRIFNVVQARAYEVDEPLWTIPGVYSPLLEAYVLIGDYSEQVLAYDASRQLFDIIKIEDGRIWGQTSELPNNYNEMKIIGRYHNDYRRLAVRYGDEIHIFAFGDPITEDADDTPTIPQSYLFTAYPNPFNP